MKPNREGYVVNWLIAGPKLSEPQHDISDINQLAFEKKLRAVIADDALTTPPEGIAPGVNGLGELPWRYYLAGENWFVDVSTFYHLLTKVELYACCELNAEAEKSVPARLWTFAAVDLWLNGEKIVTREPPVYKPIRRVDLTLPLRAGKNTLFIRMQNLGVRDTRNIFGLQLLEGAGDICVTLPDPKGELEPVFKAESWLSGVKCHDGVLRAECEPPVRFEVSARPGNKALSWVSSAFCALPKGAETASLSATIGTQTLTRVIEDRAAEKVKFIPAPASLEAHRRGVIEKIAEQYNSFGLLARYAIGKVEPEDDKRFLEILERVDKHPDCADFDMSALLRLSLKYEVKNPAVRDRMREVALNFRYWMNEKGADGMCFWSENHALLFFSCEMLSGLKYPDAVFARSGRGGEAQYLDGADRCEQWCDSILALGFEEYLSSGYMCVTTAALLNVIDFAPEALSRKAEKALDKLLRQHALHTFQGSVIGPQGRVYRDVIDPTRQGVQALMHYVDPTAPASYTMWLANFADTKYVLPEDLEGLMRANADECYPCGNAQIAIRKTRDYAITSLQSPKTIVSGWSREVYVTHDPAACGKFYYDYVKALNERFHGTSLIEPGVYGYQQHLMYAALAPKCAVFVNHPGGTHDGTAMRPGYWYGNGLFPAVQQKGSRVGVVYSLQGKHPIGFTHVFWPKCEFDEQFEQEHWLFGRKGEGYVALWCSGTLEAHDDMLIDCEKRVYDARVGYVLACSSRSEAGSFAAFVGQTVANPPAFDREALALRSGEIDIRFQEYVNDSQII